LFSSLQICHENTEILEKCKGTLLFVDTSLPKAIPIDFYLDFNSALLQSCSFLFLFLFLFPSFFANRFQFNPIAKMKPMNLQRGDYLPLFMTCSLDDRFPKDAQVPFFRFSTKSKITKEINQI